MKQKIWYNIRQRKNHKKETRKMDETTLVNVHLNIYNSHKDGSWRSSSYGWADGVEQDRNTTMRDVIDESECKLAIETCKVFSKDWGLARGPKYLFLPSGVYRQNGSGFSFMTGERDIGYTKLDSKMEKLLLDYDCLEVGERIVRWIRRTWKNFMLSIRYRLRSSGESEVPCDEGPAPCCLTAENEDTDDGK